MFKKILLAADGSEHSVRAAEYARSLAENYEGAVDVCYVVDGENAKADVLHNNDPFEIELARKEKIRQVREQFEHADYPYELHILHGEPGPTLVEFINGRDYDCVIIGSRGLNKLQTFILGSVSHKIAKRVNCPVLIVK